MPKSAGMSAGTREIRKEHRRTETPERKRSMAATDTSAGVGIGQKPCDIADAASAKLSGEMEVALLTGGFDKPYAVGLALALNSKGVCLDVIGSDEVDSPELRAAANLTFLNLRGTRRPDTSIRKKITRVLRYYARLIRYTSTAKPTIFHILWNNKFLWIDRTLLMLYYKWMGKKIAFTAHNVNAGKRDGDDSLANRITLKAQYRLADRIFVHTETMKTELERDFGIRAGAVTVIPFGINNSVPETDVTPAEARQRLGVQEGQKTILFFGSIRPYKGLEYLIAAVEQIQTTNADYRLIIAGDAIRESHEYLTQIQSMINRNSNGNWIISKLEFIPDDETELYFKAADVVVLPYTQVYQSGVLFLAYRFGLPVVATNVGSFGEDIIEGETGFLCRPCDPCDLARAIEEYFSSDLYKRGDVRRQAIRDYANERNSWDVVCEKTLLAYRQLLGREA